jgi:lipopolysaccharide export system ATP-binding protein
MALSEIEQALTHFKEGTPEAAVGILQKVTRDVPTFVLAHVLLAQALEAMGREEDAASAWRSAHRMIRDGSTIETVETTHATEVRPDALVLSATGLVKRYRKRTVVNAVELTVREGEIVGLLGPNGAGKTTTFHMMVGLVKPDRGEVRLGADLITHLPMYERARRGIGYLAQEASIFSQLTVEQNLEAVLEYQDLTRQERAHRVDELIGEFGLEQVRRSMGYMLSGGERRRTEIARALAIRPRFFLLDEPFAGVDPIAVEDIQSIVKGLRAKGIGVLITDHNVHETLAITDRAYLLYEGKILKQGSAEMLASDPEVRRRYLGEKFTLERYI